VVGSSNTQAPSLAEEVINSYIRRQDALYPSNMRKVQMRNTNIQQWVRNYKNNHAKKVARIDSVPILVMDTNKLATIESQLASLKGP